MEFRDISRVSEAITAKRIKIDPLCQRRNCSPLNVLFSVYVDIAGHSPALGRQTSAGWENTLFSSKMRQYHAPDGADGCCITSNKSFACLQLVFTSNWRNFRHAFASRGFVSVSWAFLFLLYCCFSIFPNITHPKTKNTLVK